MNEYLLKNNYRHNEQFEIEQKIDHDLSKNIKIKRKFNFKNYYNYCFIIIICIIIFFFIYNYIKLIRNNKRLKEKLNLSSLEKYNNLTNNYNILLNKYNNLLLNISNLNILQNKLNNLTNENFLYKETIKNLSLIKDYNLILQNNFNDLSQNYIYLLNNYSEIKNNLTENIEKTNNYLFVIFRTKIMNDIEEYKFLTNYLKNEIMYYIKIRDISINIIQLYYSIKSNDVFYISNNIFKNYNSILILIENDLNYRFGFYYGKNLIEELKFKKEISFLFNLNNKYVFPRNKNNFNYPSYTIDEQNFLVIGVADLIIPNNFLDNYAKSYFPMNYGAENYYYLKDFCGESNFIITRIEIYYVDILYFK